MLEFHFSNKFKLACQCRICQIESDLKKWSFKSIRSPLESITVICENRFLDDWTHHQGINFSNGIRFFKTWIPPNKTRKFHLDHDRNVRKWRYRDTQVGGKHECTNYGMLQDSSLVWHNETWCDTMWHNVTSTWQAPADCHIDVTRCDKRWPVVTSMWQAPAFQIEKYQGTSLKNLEKRTFHAAYFKA